VEELLQGGSVEVRLGTSTGNVLKLVRVYPPLCFTLANNSRKISGSLFKIRE
jgi:hypothetical protein